MQLLLLLFRLVQHLILVELKALRNINILLTQSSVQIAVDVLLETGHIRTLVAVADDAVPEFVSARETARKSQKYRVASVESMSGRGCLCGIQNGLPILLLRRTCRGLRLWLYLRFCHCIYTGTRRR